MIVKHGGQHVRWKVVWLAKGKRIEKVFGEDWQGALDLYVKAKAAKKVGATLIPMNYSIDPPAELQPHEVQKVRKSIVTRRGKRRVKKEVLTVLITPLRKLNAEGIWWCPHCGKLRKFEFKRSIKHEGKNFPEPGYYCPICTIGHKAWPVRRWNPVAVKLYDSPGRLLKSSHKPKRRSRRG